MADQSKKTRSELKSFFVPNAIPTANDFATFIDSGLNQMDDGVRVESGKVTISGAIEAKSGLAVAGAPVTLGMANDKQPLTVQGTATIADVLTAQNGFTVASGVVLLNTSATIAGQLAVSNQVNAQGNLSVTGTLTAVGGAVTIGDAATNLPMTVHHALTVNRDTLLNKGLTVKGGGVSVGDAVMPQSMTVSGASQFQGGATVSNGLNVLTGSAVFGAPVVANAGMAVRGAGVTIGDPAAKQNLTVNGAVIATELISATKGLAVAGGMLNASAGLNVTNAGVTIGVPVGGPGGNQDLIVHGVAQANTIRLVAPLGDMAPLMTARVIPPGQGASNEASELILFHGDDSAGSGLGPDYITLRAPAIRLQTYLLTPNPSIDNAATSNTRLSIDSDGSITALGRLTVNNAVTATGLVTATAGLTVTSGNTTLSGGLSVAQVPRSGSHPGSILGAYITGNFGDSVGVEVRHSNGEQGIGFGYNTIYATGSLGDQVLRLKARGTSPVEVASNLNVTGLLSGPPNDYSKAQFTLSGGGTVTWSGGRLKWTNRFIAASAGNPTSTILSGYVNIIMPTTDIPAANVHDGAPRSVANGVLLRAWEALYAVHSMGQNQDAVTFRIVVHSANHVVPNNWLLVAVMNADDNAVKLGTGQTIFDGNQLNNLGTITAGGMLYATGGATISGIATVNGNLSVAQAARSGTHPSTILGAYITGDFGESLGVEFRHSNGTQGIGIGYNTIYAAGSSTNQSLRLRARGASSVEVEGNLYISSNLSGPPNDYMRAQFVLSGGGTVTWIGGRLKWTTRFIAISAGLSPNTLATGHINVQMPSTDIPAANVYDGTARSVTTGGIFLKPWEALYAVHTPGQNEAAVQLKIVCFNAPHIVASNWILVAVVNNDNVSSVKLGTGQTIFDGNTLTNVGPLNVGGLVTANSGLTVANGGLNVTGLATFNTGITLGNGPLWANGLVSANAGLTVSGGDLYSNSRITANAGLTVANGDLWSNVRITANAGLTVATGDLWSNVRITANAGLTIANGDLWSTVLVTANAGLNVNNGPLNVANFGGGPALVVNGTAMVGALWFTPPPSDPVPTITARTIPVGQGASNESSELILFHGNDAFGGAGCDYITLRAPALRFQTYNDPGVSDINNQNGSQTRLLIDPNGSLFAYGTLTVPAITFPAIPGDPPAYITTRTIPPNQGGTNEATELILFNCNDPTGGFGADVITLRAPGLRFQTYNDTTVMDINNPNGSQTRMYIEPTGQVQMYQGILRLGPTTGVAPGQVTGVVGCMGNGVSHGQIAYRAGFGFELVDISSQPAPIQNYVRDQFPYTDLRLRQLQYQTQNQFSSRTLKEDIRDLSARDAMDAFEKLQPVTYRMKAEPTGRTHVGFIAEDVPDLVSADEHKAIAPVDILAVLTRIVHVQQESIRRLEAQIAALTPS